MPAKLPLQYQYRWCLCIVLHRATLKIQTLAKIINNNEDENFLDGNGVISLTAVLNLLIQSIFVFFFKNAKYAVYAGKIPKYNNNMLFFLRNPQYVVLSQKQ